MEIRNSIKAIIIQDDMLLLIKQQDQDGFFYLLPGGGQKHGENMHQALKRECIEEINVKVEIGNLLFVREYIGKNHEFDFDKNLHQIEYIFICNIKENQMVRNGIQPDSDQIGVEWLPIQELINYRIYPKAIIQYIVDFVEAKETSVYLGDVN